MKQKRVSGLFSRLAEAPMVDAAMMFVLDRVMPRALAYGVVATGAGLAVPATMYQEGFEAGALAALAIDGSIQLVRAGVRLSRRFADEAAGRATVPQPRSSKPRYQPAPAGLSQAHS